MTKIFNKIVFWPLHVWLGCVIKLCFLLRVWNLLRNETGNFQSPKCHSKEEHFAYAQVNVSIFIFKIYRSVKKIFQASAIVQKARKIFKRYSSFRFVLTWKVKIGQASKYFFLFFDFLLPCVYVYASVCARLFVSVYVW